MQFHVAWITGLPDGGGRRTANRCLGHSSARDMDEIWATLFSPFEQAADDAETPAGD
jgi:hypothetical protein